MDVRQYFRKLREVEGGLQDPFPVIISLETSDGGKPGVISEVSREAAAKLILEGKAVLASDGQKQDFLTSLEARKRSAEKSELARRIQVAIIADPELQNSVVNKRGDVPGIVK